MKKAEARRALFKHFTIYQRKFQGDQAWRNHWIVECDTCETRWKLRLDDNREVPAGNVLHLINHARSHGGKK